MAFKLGLKGKAKAGWTDLVGLDFGVSGIKVVRLRKAGTAVTLVGVDILPPLAVDGSTDTATRFKLAKSMASPYGVACLGGEELVLRLIPHPPPEGNKPLEQLVRDQLGLKSAYRMGFVSTATRQPKGEGRLLVAALPEEKVLACLSLFEVGVPALCSLEPAGLSAMRSMMPAPEEVGEEHICLLEAGGGSAFVAFTKGTQPDLVRHFTVGGEHLLKRIEEHFGVPREVALSICCEGAIDLSQVIRALFGDFMRQLCISRDYVERQENCRIRKVRVSGGLSMVKGWMEELAAVTGMEVESVDPFKGVERPEATYPETWVGHEGRFAAAVGAVTGVFQGL